MTCKDFIKEWINNDEQLSCEAKEHLVNCRECREKVEQYKSAIALLKTPIKVDMPDLEDKVMAEISTPHIRSNAKRWIISTAAACVLMLITVKVFHYREISNAQNREITEMIADVYDTEKETNTTTYSELAMVEYFIENVE